MTKLQNNRILKNIVSWVKNTPIKITWLLPFPWPQSRRAIWYSIPDYAIYMRRASYQIVFNFKKEDCRWKHHAIGHQWTVPSCPTNKAHEPPQRLYPFGHQIWTLARVPTSTAQEQQQNSNYGHHARAPAMPCFVDFLHTHWFLYFPGLLHPKWAFKKQLFVCCVTNKHHTWTEIRLNPTWKYLEFKDAMRTRPP